MRVSTRASRLVAAAGLAGGIVLLGAAPALADTGIAINPGNLPAVATDYETGCSQTGTSATRDGWVFVLPGKKGVFTSLTLTFDTGGGTATVSIPADGTIGGAPGASKAWTTTPAGWTLTAATATVSGTSPGFFTLTHTCPATGTPTPSPSVDVTPSPEEPPATPTPDTSFLGDLAPLADTPQATALGVLVTVGGLGGIAGLIRGARRRRDLED